MWEPNEIRLMRWFMRFAGAGLLIPGLIYLGAWPDTLKAFTACFGAGIAPAAAAFVGAALIIAGATFIAARSVRLGAVLGFAALLLGSIVHYQWSVMMHDRLPILLEHTDAAQRALLEDTVLFAANAQLPHIFKNIVLMGVCAMLFCLAPTICGNRFKRRVAADPSSAD